ncbi:hypothetical protein CCZ01_05945 [Helicobacter monodelphidis]|uniref:YbgC/FadM family acyl-CoA thioesterase n=1 Tax=Helicobacter sp. 15-1451 TaxID=2004995 RepID=UPI000DCD4AE3|nr:YbgC/FadM family acyl-CoA thioesterase [Helicobacter sp. 15-1451]RAX57522.1 hypothetical protein CCZ01_05945 [Helicobacter sp. 15-1451]
MEQLNYYPVRVYYEDTDCGGIVYHANYLKFCERARSEAFFQKGRLPESDEYSFVVKKIEAEYFTPAKLGDSLQVFTQTLEVKGASLSLKQEIWRQDTQSKKEEKIFTLTALIVCIKNGHAVKIPTTMKSQLIWS